MFIVISNNVAVDFVIQELFNKYVEGLSYLLVYVNTMGDPTLRKHKCLLLSPFSFIIVLQTPLLKTTVPILFVRISNMIRQHGDTAI
jgi:hypothetical protein